MRVYPYIEQFHPSYKDFYEANTVQHWGFFTSNDLLENPGKLLMLDLDFGKKCSLNCPSCFRRKNVVDDDQHKNLTYNQLLDVIDEACTIGLRTIKICGAGEPLENPLLLDFARELTKRGIGLSIFTKGHVLGDDKLVEYYYNTYGITDARTLCQEFYKLQTSFLVGFQSAYPEVQDKLVGGIDGYTIKRNRAIELLAEEGFNKTVPSRLAICSNPITKQNYPELLDIYTFGRTRNMLPVIAALMTSGKQIDSEFLLGNDVSDLEKDRLFSKVYEYNLANGYANKEDLHDRISCMPGIHPCNQIAAGLYLTDNGNVIRCPGDTGKPLGNVHDNSIVRIWDEYKDWHYLGQHNCYCPYKDGNTLPFGIYDRTKKSCLIKS